MLYVFLVDTGAMLTFEMELAMESVETLMQTITSMFMIPIEKQVLIMQGGEALDPSQRICNYSSAGTENNPIFLFSKSTIESPVPPSPSLNLGSETTLKEEVELSLKLPPTYETLVSRAHLALRLQDMAAELSQSCISMVNEQYLQRQGWIAVIANLENIASTFQTRATLLEQNYSHFLELIPHYNTLLHRFPEVIRLLSKIPVFCCLLQNEMNTPKEKHVTLLDWINAQDRKNNLEDMVHQCIDYLDQIQKLSLPEIKEDRDQVLGDVSNKNMKDIGGLEERLNLLSRLCENSRKLEQEQSDMAQGFSQNQIRAQNIGDPSVLPDLCSSHRKQLSLLMNNHSQLRDIRRRCAKAKDELSGNLHARLRWVMMLEKKICDCDNKLVLYHESMKRIKKHIDILEQIERAPCIYALAVKEVVRRRYFTSQFMKWAKTIAHESEGIYKEEVARRLEFSQFMGHHFLQSLFTGINDVPTPFAHSAPELFDIELPPISSEELKELVTQVPELMTLDWRHGSTAKENNIPRFVRTRSLSYDDLPTINTFVVDTCIDEIDTIVCAAETTVKYTEDNVKKSDATMIQSSETTTDKVCVVKEVGIHEFHIKKNWDEIGTVPIHDGHDIQESSNSKIISLNFEVKENVMKNIGEIREDLAKFASATLLWRNDIDEFLCERTRLFERRQVSEGTKEQETMTDNDNIKTLTRKVVSLTAENESLRKELKVKEKTFTEQVMRYRTELKEQKRFTNQMESDKEKFEAEQQIRFNSAIGKVMKEKDASLKKANDQLSEGKNLQAKNEEKLQILFNEKEELRLEKENGDKKLMEAFEEFSTQKLELERCLLDARKSLEEKDNLLAKYCAKDEGATEVEKQETDSLGSGQIIGELVVERFHKRIKHLEEENSLLKDRLHSGPDGDDKILFVELQQCLDEKSKECDSLRAELELLQQRPRSVQVVFKDFQKGDIVQVYFNEEYGLFMVQSTTDTLYFVHPDSLVNLEIPADLSRTSSFQAQVLDKEYCQAKKANNRFKVTVGTKFYRVKVRSWTPSS